MCLSSYTEFLIFFNGFKFVFNQLMLRQAYFDCPLIFECCKEKDYYKLQGNKEKYEKVIFLNCHHMTKTNRVMSK